MDNSYLELINKKKQDEIIKIKNCNEYTSQYGLTLTDSQINSIIERRIETLKDTGRVEFREGIIDKIIKEFCDSPYILKETYATTLYELIEIFYEYKNETMDLISDDELIKFMKDYFNGECQGDLDYLSGTIMYNMKQNLLQGFRLDYKKDEDYE